MDQIPKSKNSNVKSKYSYLTNAPASIESVGSKKKVCEKNSNSNIISSHNSDE